VDDDLSHAAAAAGPAALAEQAHQLVGADPHHARGLAQRALDGALAAADHDTASVAQRALGMISMELEDAPTAVEHLRTAIATAQRGGAPVRVAEARMSLAFALINQGEATAALRQARLATRRDAGDSATLHSQHALILERLGRNDAALGAYAQGLQIVRRTGDRSTEAKLLCNRGVLHAFSGALCDADADLRASERLAEQLGLSLMAATIRQNIGWVTALRGDLPQALADMDAAEPLIAAAGGTRHGLFEFERCYILLSAGLAREAMASAQRAVELLEATAMGAELAEARLALAEAALANADPDGARAAAEQARRDFRRQRRPEWAALAEHVAVRAAFGSGGASAELLRRARRTAADLQAGGKHTAALNARILVARIALALGRGAQAARELEAVAHARRDGPVTLRVGAWHAEALRRHAEGRATGALRALRAGLDVLEQHRLSLGATELRAGAAVHGNALAALGQRLALESGRPAAVLAWAERGRAGALWQRPVRPPGDDVLAADLAELRTVLAAAAAAAPGSPEARRLFRREAELEASIRHRARHASGPGAGAASGAGGLPLADLRAALGSRALVEFLDAGASLAAVVVCDGRTALVTLGSAAEVQRELGALRFALRRLARGAGSAASRAVARENAEHAAGRLDALLLAPLGARIGERELVLVPTGELHAVPWPALPSCAGRALSVAPSAALWLRAARARNRGMPAAGRARLLLAAGPGLPDAAAEVGRLAARHPAATALLGDDARVAAVAAALESADRAHIASHGVFRADNPLFSSLQLADGPLTIYDLERLRASPREMILSSCDGGVTAVRPGDELMGFSAALLALGTSALTASVMPVPDEPTQRLMLALHERLDDGDEPAPALMRARAQALDCSTDGDYATAAGFVCFGAGSAAAADAAASSA
jgi:tetratricopeptide (TPR) repeat protein